MTRHWPVTSSQAVRGLVIKWVCLQAATLHTQFDMMSKYFHFKYSPGDYCLNSMLSNNLKVSRMLGPEVTGSWVWRVWHNRNTDGEILILWSPNDQSPNCFFIFFFIRPKFSSYPQPISHWTQCFDFECVSLDIFICSSEFTWASGHLTGEMS